jgi:hypothetical protein
MTSLLEVIAVLKPSVWVHRELKFANKASGTNFNGSRLGAASGQTHKAISTDHDRNGSKLPKKQRLYDS